MASPIGERARKLLWVQSDRCAFPGCNQSLLVRGPDGVLTTVGVECHIVARSHDGKVARTPKSLSPAERAAYAGLIEDRDAESNVVLMCQTHAKLIDDPGQGFSVQRLLEIKAAHLKKLRRERELGARVASGELGPGEVATQAIAGAVSAAIADAGAWDHKAMKALVAADAQDAAWLLDQLGSTDEARNVQRLVDDWPDRLSQGRDELVVALARKAERHARYDLGATVWERLSDRAQERPVRADRLARAAIDARIADQLERERDLLDRADAADPACVRARLQRLDYDGDPRALLDELAKLSSEDQSLQALIELQRCRAQMMTAPLAVAEQTLARARALDPDSLYVRLMSVNLRIQRARIGVRDDVEFSLLESRKAKQDALTLRDELLRLGRHSESVRVLMLAADADAVERDPEKATATLELATRQEIDSDDDGVLGDAALRAVNSDLALRFCERGEGAVVRRIRATAALDGRADEREAGLRTLEALAVADCSEAEMAAAARLLACFEGAPLHEPSAQKLEAGLHARIAHSARAYVHARRGDHLAAEKEIEPYRKTRWGAEMALRLAAERGNEARLRETARTVLAVGADPFGRFEAGLALARAGELQEAAGVLSGVARSLNAPEKLRSRAFDGLLQVCADRNAWDEAKAAWEEWRELLAGVSRTDARLSAWQVRVSRRRD